MPGDFLTRCKGTNLQIWKAEGLFRYSESDKESCCENSFSQLTFGVPALRVWSEELHGLISREKKTRALLCGSQRDLTAVSSALRAKGSGGSLPCYL